MTGLPIAIALMALAAGTDDGGVSVTARVDNPVTPFHQDMTLTITVEAPAELDISLPNLGESIGGLDVHGEPVTHTEAAGAARTRRTVRYTLDPVFVGDYVIESMEVTWGENGRAATPPLAVRVRELTPEEEQAAQQFLPYAGPIEVPPPFWRTWPFLAGAAAVALLVAGALIYLVAFRRKRPAFSAPPALPWEAALEKLRALEERGWRESGEYGPYHVELSAILRHYIEDRFHLHAPEQTTPEFLADAARSGLLTSEQQHVLAKLLRHSDMVKFARYVPTADEMLRSLEQVREFVDETAPRPEPAEEAAA
jgi:hypothetical protein